MIPGSEFTIAGADLVDGTGAARRRAKVAVRDGVILAVGTDADGLGLPEVAADGLVLAPGFIDAHAHDDAALIETPDMAMKTSQGITTTIIGNCGASAAPYDTDMAPVSVLRLLFKHPGIQARRYRDFLANVDAARPAINAIGFVGHATLRLSVMGEDFTRAARPDERETMRDLLATALDDGAAGLSTGLFYPTAKAAPTQEVIDIGAPLRAAGGLYATHMRDEGDGLMASIDEALAIGRALGVRTIVSHLKCVGARNFGRSLEALEKLDAAMATQQVGFDVYPYIAGSTILLEENVEDCGRVIITWSDPFPEATGRNLDDLAAEWGIDRFAATRKLQPGGAIYFKMSEDDVRRIIAHPGAMIGSDGIPGDAFPHPRLWGSFPRVLGLYVRELGLVSLEQAIHRMTALPAANFGLKNRGRIAPGLPADLVLLDPGTVGDRADFATPQTPSAGINAVYVAGEKVWDGGKPTGNRPGRMFRRQELQAL